MRLKSWWFALVLLVAAPALAQKVVILEIDGDAAGRLRTQIEKATREAGTVTVVPLKAYKDAAASVKLKGAAAMTPEGVARVAKKLAFDAAVGGAVSGGAYTVQISDRSGQQLWTKSLKVKKGLLSDDFAGKLARAIAAAGEQGAARAAPTEAPEQPPEKTPDPVVADTSGSGGATEGSSEGTADAEGAGSGRRTVITSAGGATEGGGEERDEDLDDPTGRKRRQAREREREAEEAARPIVAVPLFRAWLAGATTWRSQCLRPGVTSCQEYALASTKPKGIAIDFISKVPYLGLALNAELFPLARLRSRVAQGFGLLGAFSWGQSVTLISEESIQGAGSPQLVNSTDLGWSLQLAWRWHFEAGYGTPAPVASVGLRGGLLSRNFIIDPAAGTSLPSSDRTYPTGLGFPVFGLDASVPIARFFRIEASASLFVNPRTSEEQIIGYGNLADPTGGATATGWSVEGGFAGELWGPLGYVLRLRHLAFADRYFGQGQKWTICGEAEGQCGGAGEESYTSVLWGVTATF